MRRQSYIALHKSEWDRMHRKTDDKNRLPDQRDSYFRRLVEISQGWIKTWPDTVQDEQGKSKISVDLRCYRCHPTQKYKIESVLLVQFNHSGHVEQVKKQNLKHHQEEIALVKSYLNKKKKDSTKEAIKKAKQLIFESSSYGKQLISALIASKVLEERDRQVEFQKELKQIKQDQEKEEISKLKLNGCTFNLDKHEEDKNRKKKEMEIELAKLNRAIFEMDISESIKVKKDQEKLDHENARLMQELLDNEKQQEKEYEHQLSRDVELYERGQKIARERKVEREKKEEDIVNAQAKELYIKNCKIRRVMKNMHSERQNTERYKRNYEMIKEIQEKEVTRYHEFLQEGNKKLQDRKNKEEQEYTIKQKLESDKRNSVALFNKMAAEKSEKCRVDLKRFHCCVAERQSILPKSRYKKKTSAIQEKQPINFMVHPKNLQEQLEARKKQPSPWTGLSATHAQFAEQASNVLQEVQYKHFVRKVVDDYRKTNCLDANTLPVPNYD